MANFFIGTMVVLFGLFVMVLMITMVVMAIEVMWEIWRARITEFRTWMAQPRSNPLGTKRR